MVQAILKRPHYRSCDPMSTLGLSSGKIGSTTSLGCGHGRCVPGDDKMSMVTMIKAMTQIIILKKRMT